MTGPLAPDPRTTAQRRRDWRQMRATADRSRSMTRTSHAMTAADTDPLYRINDVLTALANELGAPFTSEDDEDDTLNDLTHEIARALRAGPYRYGDRVDFTTPRERAAALLTDTDIAGLLAGEDAEA